MLAQYFLLIVSVVILCFQWIGILLSDIQKKKPLPEIVSDIYDADRYKKFIEYNSAKKKLKLVTSISCLLVDMIVIFSPFFSLMEKNYNYSVYRTTIYTTLILITLSLIIKLPFDYYDTFKLEAKFELNKKTLREFIKDFLVEGIFGLVVSVALFALFVYVGENMQKWTNNYQVSMSKAWIISLSIASVLGLIYALLMFLSYGIFHLLYKFTPLEEGELRTKILGLLDGSKKKVKYINVYNESKKSVKKNAFLLKLFWHREFGIADNFITGNAQRELLGVLSHEVGHLKHKKNLLNYLTYIFVALCIVALAYIIYSPKLLLSISQWSRASFNLSINNYYVLFLIAESIITPILFSLMIFQNYRSRQEEYEADRESVKNGYGVEMIELFKSICKEELVDVNPHPINEFVKYDHPGMVNRLTAIKNGINPAS
ncbi:MAG: M48 family metalloprotease [Alphaproteobacteria bacterium]|nr:M48 family metalloprotease [Alphaproteobacteria bacterium]